MSLARHLVADHISNPNRNKSPSVHSFQQSSGWKDPKYPLSCPMLLWVLAHCFVPFASSCMMPIKSWRIRLHLWLTLKTKAQECPGLQLLWWRFLVGHERQGPFCAPKKSPWDSHGSVSDRDCKLLSLIQKSTSLAFRRCSDSGLWIRIYHWDFCFCLQGISRSQFNLLLGRIVVEI